jgi:hypothetical protein
MALRSDSGMTCSVRIRPIRKLSRLCIVLLVLKMLLQQIITWSYLVIPISEM